MEFTLCFRDNIDKAGKSPKLLESTEEEEDEDEESWLLTIAETRSVESAEFKCRPVAHFPPVLRKSHQAYLLSSQRAQGVLVPIAVQAVTSYLYSEVSQ